MKLNLKLNKFKDHLPDIQTQSTSYGGQYYSDWIVIFILAAALRPHDLLLVGISTIKNAQLKMLSGGLEL